MEGSMSKISLICGIAAGPLFVLSFLIQGATRDGYDPMRHPVSSLALGDHGWTQTATFLITGTLTIVFAVGLQRTLRRGPGRLWGPLLVGVWAIGLVGAGLFTTDPVSGYPPGSPNLMPAYGSTHAALHDGVSLVAFIAIMAVCIVFARRFVADNRRAWALYSAATAIAVLVTLALSGAAFAQSPNLVAFGGLFQRIMIVAAWSWLTLLARDTYRNGDRPRPDSRVR
ncbi:DUF998 domain-containing protein [Streptosporangium sp. NPDC051022]|uniref:DUF998 domain-containing protein n=1 Tax=Streptosporangium sp. NPDC051022 TaxID=3155752 RepID=UPI00343CA149